MVIIEFSLAVGSKSVPKIMINDTVKFFFLNCNQHFGNFNSFQVLFDIITSVFLFEKCIISLEMVGPGNRHCANCIGTVSFPISLTAGSTNWNLGETFHNSKSKPCGEYDGSICAAAAMLSIAAITVASCN